MTHRLVVEISDTDFELITNTIKKPYQDAGQHLPPNFGHIAIHKMLDAYVTDMAKGDAIFEFDEDCGFDNIFNMPAPKLIG
jgi:hypothetical protein